MDVLGEKESPQGKSLFTQGETLAVLCPSKALCCHEPVILVSGLKLPSED